MKTIEQVQLTETFDIVLLTEQLKGIHRELNKVTFIGPDDYEIKPPDVRLVRRILESSNFSKAMALVQQAEGLVYG